jgi:hypothetical protein
MLSDPKVISRGEIRPCPSITWLDRSEIAAHFIRPTDRVCDLGAGAQTLRRFLPDTVAYYPVDRRGHHEDTWVTDFNGDFSLPDVAFDVLVCMGVLTHLSDPERFLRRLSEMHPGVFMVFSDDVRVSPPDLYGLVRNLAVAARMRQHRIVTGTLGAGDASRTLRPLHQISLAYVSPTGYAQQLCLQFMRRRRRRKAQHQRQAMQRKQ